MAEMAIVFEDVREMTAIFFSKVRVSLQHLYSVGRGLTKLEKEENIKSIDIDVG